MGPRLGSLPVGPPLKANRGMPGETALPSVPVVVTALGEIFGTGFKAASLQPSRASWSAAPALQGILFSITSVIPETLLAAPLLPTEMLAPFSDAEPGVQEFEAMLFPILDTWPGDLLNWLNFSSS